MTVLVVRYGRNSVSGLPRIDMPNFEPSDKRLRFAQAEWSTVPDPSIAGMLSGVGD